MSLNRACDPGPAPTVADSAVVLGEAWVGAGAILAQGLVVRSHEQGVTIGNHSAILENGTVWGSADHPARVGQRTVFGHRVSLLGATVGDMCEIGNGAILMPGAQLGDGCILGEGTLIPRGMVVPPQTVVVGRPPHVLRSATEEDLERVKALREGEIGLTGHPHQLITGTGASMGRVYDFQGKTPRIDPTVTLFDSAEVTGDVVIGARTVIGAGVKIIGDSHGPVRIGADVQILENTVLHLLPDNELIVEDGVVIGPGSMIHGCHIGRGSVVEVGAIVCDWSRIGEESIVSAGACVKQRAQFPPRSYVDGFPAKVTATLDAPPDPPAWAFTAESLRTVTRVR